MFRDDFPRLDRGSESTREALDLHVVRRHHDQLVARLHEPHQQHAVGLRPAVCDLDVIDRRTRIHRRDRFPQRHGAVRLRIAELLLEDRVTELLRVRDLGHAQRLDAAFGDVPCHPVLPDRLETLERERFDLHCEKCSPKSAIGYPLGEPMPSEQAPELVLIPSGEFLMGSEDAEEDERPVHRVHVDDFFLAVQPVTNAEYARFVRETGHRSPAIYELPVVVKAGGVERERSFRHTGSPYVWEDGHPSMERADHPVTLVRYDDSAAYCAWLAGTTGKPYRLPTEAEWEKAARGGAESKRYPWGDRLDRNMANFLVDPALGATHGTTPCRSYPPNGYGLYDMAGNVWEWVSDWYDARYYGASSARNPTGPAGGHLRVLRGGSWLVADVRMLSCSHRHKVPPDTYSYAIGFRV